MGFRTNGVAHDGQSWTLSFAVAALAGEVDSIEGRPTGSDGTVASARHDAVSPNSDHTPKPATGVGTVRAIDVTVTREQGSALTEKLRQDADPRVRYVIYNQRMFSSYERNGIPPFTWRPYGGSNGHINHFHLSAWPLADTDSSPWGIADVPLGGNEVTIEQLQEMLNARGASLTVDGVYGPKTKAEWANSAGNGTGPQGPKGDKGDVGDTGCLARVHPSHMYL